MLAFYKGNHVFFWHKKPNIAINDSSVQAEAPIPYSYCSYKTAVLVFSTMHLFHTMLQM